MDKNSHLGKINLLESQSINYHNINLSKDDLTVVGYEWNRTTEKQITKPTNFLIGVLRRFLHNKWAVGFLFLLLIIFLLAIIVPIVSPYPAYSVISTSVPSVWLKSLPPRLIGQNPIFTYKSTISKTQVDALIAYDEAGNYGIIVNVNWLSDNSAAIVTLYPYKIPALSNIYPLIGTDINGFDMWTKMWTAFANSLGLGVIVAIASIIIGSVYGSIAGSFAGKMVDIVMMRIIDIVGSIPTIVLLIVLSLVLSGNDSSTTSLNSTSLTVALILISWMGPAYLVRMHIIRTKDAEYIQTTRVIGASKARVLFTHLLPNISGRIFVRFIHAIPSVIFLQAGLVFIGLQTTDTHNFGEILQDCYEVTNIPQMIYGPVVLFALFTVSLQIIANALNDAIDPRIVGR